MKEVAEILKVTPRTIAYHKYKIMSDVHLRSTAELIRYTLKAKILPG